MEKMSDRVRKILSLYDEIKAGVNKSELRFNVSYIGVYWIADQFFCEKQVELYMKSGDVQTEKTKIGKNFHEGISAGMEQANLEKIWCDILSGSRLYVSNMALVAKWKGVPIVGRSDLLLFSKGKPLWLFEFKFTNMRIPPDSSHVQARIYSLLLKLMGFNVSMLKYAVVLSKDKLENFETWRRLVIDKVQKHILFKEKAVVKIDNCRAFIRKPNLDKAEKELDFALGYWMNRREAIPTKNASKCKSCAYITNCDSKLILNKSSSTSVNSD